MLATVLLINNLDQAKEAINSHLARLEIAVNSPDLMRIDKQAKLGLDQMKGVKEFLSLKPYQSKVKVVLIEDISALSQLSQNSLLKTIEELGDQSAIMMVTTNLTALLPTFLSRVRVERVHSVTSPPDGFEEEIERLVKAPLQQRFEYVEKFKERGEFLENLGRYYQNKMLTDPRHIDFGQKLLEATKWTLGHVNQRAILEYLMLELGEK